jgi:hypothetical protein
MEFCFLLLIHQIPPNPGSDKFFDIVDRGIKGVSTRIKGRMHIRIGIVESLNKDLIVYR